MLDIALGKKVKRATSHTWVYDVLGVTCSNVTRWQTKWLKSCRMGLGGKSHLTKRRLLIGLFSSAGTSTSKDKKIFFYNKLRIDENKITAIKSKFYQIKYNIFKIIITIKLIFKISIIFLKHPIIILLFFPVNNTGHPISQLLLHTTWEFIFLFFLCFSHWNPKHTWILRSRHMTSPYLLCFNRNFHQFQNLRYFYLASPILFLHTELNRFILGCDFG